jgi:hypothetical protein
VIKPSKISTTDVDYIEIFGSLLSKANSRSQNRTLYEATNDPGLPIAELCEAVKAAGDAESVTVPAWAAHALAEGFNRYLKSEVLGGRSMTLEQCLGINKAAKGSSTFAITDADKMAIMVHRVRWVLGLKSIGLACRIAYEITLQACEWAQLPSERAGVTQSEESFQQYYVRNHAKQFVTWKAECEATGNTPNDESRNVILSFLLPELRARVTKRKK